MGMNLTTFFMIYAKKALRDRRIPFEVTAPLDSFKSIQIAILYFMENKGYYAVF